MSWRRDYSRNHYQSDLRNQANEYYEWDMEEDKVLNASRSSWPQGLFLTPIGEGKYGADTRHGMDRREYHDASSKLRLAHEHDSADLFQNYRGNENYSESISSTRSRYKRRRYSPSRISGRILWIVVAIVILIAVVIAAITLSIYFALKDPSHSTAKDSITTTTPPPELNTIKLLGKLKLFQNFTTELNDNTSEEFKNLSQTFCSTLTGVYQSSNLSGSYKSCTVTKFSNGSVLVDYILEFFTTKLQEVFAEKYAAGIDATAFLEEAVKVILTDATVADNSSVFLKGLILDAKFNITISTANVPFVLPGILTTTSIVAITSDASSGIVPESLFETATSSRLIISPSSVGVVAASSAVAVSTTVELAVLSSTDAPSISLIKSQQSTISSSLPEQVLATSEVTIIESSVFSTETTTLLAATEATTVPPSGILLTETSILPTSTVQLAATEETTVPPSSILLTETTTSEVQLAATEETTFEPSTILLTETTTLPTSEVQLASTDAITVQPSGILLTDQTHILPTSAVNRLAATEATTFEPSTLLTETTLPTSEVQQSATEAITVQPSGSSFTETTSLLTTGVLIAETTTEPSSFESTSPSTSSSESPDSSTTTTSLPITSAVTPSSSLSETETSISVDQEPSTLLFESVSEKFETQTSTISSIVDSSVGETSSSSISSASSSFEVISSDEVTETTLINIEETTNVDSFSFYSTPIATASDDIESTELEETATASL